MVRPEVAIYQVRRRPRIAVPLGCERAFPAARAHDPELLPQPRHTLSRYTFAHTTPLYFTDAQANDASLVSAQHLTAVINEIWRRVDQRDAWTPDEDRAAYRSHLDEALAVLAKTS